MRLLRPMPPTLLPTAAWLSFRAAAAGRSQRCCSCLSSSSATTTAGCTSCDGTCWPTRLASGRWSAWTSRWPTALTRSTRPASPPASTATTPRSTPTRSTPQQRVQQHRSSSCTAAPLSSASASTSPLWSFAGGSLLSLFSGPSSTPPALQLADQSLSSPVVVNGVPTWPWSQTLSVTTGSLSLSGSRTLYFAIPGWLMWQRNAAQSLVAFTDSVTVSSGNGPQQSVSYTVSVLQYDGFAPSAGVFAAAHAGQPTARPAAAARARPCSPSQTRGCCCGAALPSTSPPLPPPPPAAAAPAPARPSLRLARFVSRPRPQLCCSARRRHRRRLPCTWEATRAVCLTRASWC